MTDPVLPNGETVDDVVGSRIEKAYRSGHTPALLPKYRSSPSPCAGSPRPRGIAPQPER